MSLAARIQRIFENITLAATRKRQQTKDPNFIGFSKYRDRGAYHWDLIGRQADYTQRLEFVVERVRPQDRCLDLGCGDGAYMGAVAKKCAEVVGLDADFDAVRHARQKLAATGVQNAKVLQTSLGQARTAGIGKGQDFDVVYSMDVLEHLPDPRELLREAVWWCKPAGKVIIGTPIFVKAELVSTFHVKEYSAAELNELMAQYLAPFESVSLPMLRNDGATYENSYYVAVGQPARTNGLS